MRGRLRPAGLLWFAFRKGFKPPDLTRDHGWQVVTAQGYDTVRAIAVDGAWSALRFASGRNARPDRISAPEPGPDEYIRRRRTAIARSYERCGATGP